jgi:hypothetical protein
MRVSVMAMLLLNLAVGSAYAQGASEEEARQACAPEALKFCSTEVPDRDRVERCLRAKINQISPDCRAVMNGGRPARRG